ncbi:MAG TPA: GMC family oxidoreductase [Solirubrobacteraceae bacterium]|nr:GMC family oxidoreductase [Solirubrobacteraceae bacterium]
MAPASVVIVGSGAGGSVAAWALASAGHPVLVLERGRNLFTDLGGPGDPGTLLWGDEVARARFLEQQDPLLEPRTFRTQAEAIAGVGRSFVGDVNDLPATVGGGTVHWDAKTPRLWRQDFHGCSLHGPIKDANLADWPLSYEELAPFYDEVEALIGVQGDVDLIPAATLQQAPRSGPFPFPPNPPMLAGSLLAKGAAHLGMTAYPVPMAVHPQVCNSCGFCGGFGCAIHARGGAITLLHEALRAGAELRSRCFVDRIELAPDGRTARGVSYLEADGTRRREQAEVVVVAASAIETARLLLLSELGGDNVGRHLMFHHLTSVAALFEEPVHPWRGPTSTHTLDDLIGPFGGAEAGAPELPYVKGGVVELGSGVQLLEEAKAYARSGLRGKALKAALRDVALRDHVASMTMIGEDLPQNENRVDLDPAVRDFHSVPAPRIAYTPHRFERAAAAFASGRLSEIVQATGGAWVASPPDAGENPRPGGAHEGQGPFGSAHILGTARMGNDPSASVTDAFGRLHDVPNVVIADGSVFVTSGCANPTLTIMALALRAARTIGR